jgi:hypothetical protein
MAEWNGWMQHRKKRKWPPSLLHLAVKKTRLWAIGSFLLSTKHFLSTFSLFKRGNAIIPYFYSLSHSSDFTLQSSITFTLAYKFN